MGTGETLPGPGIDKPGAAGAYNRTNGKSHRAGRESDGVTVPKIAKDNITWLREGPLPHHVFGKKGKVGACQIRPTTPKTRPENFRTNCTGQPNSRLIDASMRSMTGFIAETSWSEDGNKSNAIEAQQV